MNKLLASSTDPKQVSLTLQGVLAVFVPLAAYLVRQAGGELDADVTQRIIDISSQIVIAIGSLASLIMMLVGLVRKVANTFGK